MHFGSTPHTCAPSLASSFVAPEVAAAAEAAAAVTGSAMEPAASSEEAAPVREGA